MNASQGFDQNLSLDIEVPVDSHGFQLKLLQRDHGGGGCNCWRVASLALSNHVQMEAIVILLHAVWRGIQAVGHFIWVMPGNLDRGMITTAFYCSELSSDECPGDSDRLYIP